jgi:hypothetical protein
VIFGTAVAKSMLPSAGPLVIDRPGSSDRIAGNHALVIVGYDSAGFQILNSWGSGWRAGGLCWFTDDYITWNRTRDLTIVQGWNRLHQEENDHDQA